MGDGQLHLLRAGEWPDCYLQWPTLFTSTMAVCSLSTISMLLYLCRRRQKTLLDRPKALFSEAPIQLTKSLSDLSLLDQIQAETMLLHGTQFKYNFWLCDHIPTHEKCKKREKYKNFDALRLEQCGLIIYKCPECIIKLWVGTESFANVTRILVKMQSERAYNQGAASLMTLKKMTIWWSPNAS